MSPKELLASAFVVALLVGVWRLVVWLRHRNDPPRKSDAQLRAERLAREEAARSNFNPAELKRQGVENAEIERLRKIREKEIRDWLVEVEIAKKEGRIPPPAPPTIKPKKLPPKVDPPADDPPEAA